MDSDASFSPIGTTARACEHCYNEYTAWEKGRLGARALADGKDGGNAPVEVVVKPKEPPKRGMLARMESIAASVPRDWNWSTF